MSHPSLLNRRRFSARQVRVQLVGLGLLGLALSPLYPAVAATQIVGAGSTFDYPFFSKAFYTYSQAHPDVTVNYQSIGSGGGIQQFTAKTVDFGASDVPMDAQELARAKDPVLQIPVTLGGAGIAYNLPGIAKGLHLTRALVADIYLGKVTKWNDPAIAKLNPRVKLPSMAITVVHRSDGSGTELHLHRLPEPCVASVEAEGGHRQKRAVAGVEQCRRQGQ